MKTDREKQGFRDSVERVLVETAQFEEQAGQLTEKPWFSHKLTFNREGWLTEQITRNPDGSEWRTVNDYSDSGNLLATKAYESSGVLVNEVRYIYVEERLVAEEHRTQDGKVTTPALYTYDIDGEKTKIQERNLSREGNVMIGIEGTSTIIAAGEA